MQIKKGVINFWIANFCSWGFFYLIQLFTSPLFLEIEPVKRILILMSFLIWVMLITGAYRFVYNKYQFETRTLSFNILQILISGIIMFSIDLICRLYLNNYVDTIYSYFPHPAYDTPIGRVMHANENNTDFAFFSKWLLVNAQLFKFFAYLSWLAVYNFFSYYTALQNTRIENLHFENKAKDAELARLQSQLNPHFLFNALNSIHSLTMFDAPKSSEAVMLLSDLMRYTLNYGNKELVTVREETDIISKYIALEQIRFGNKLNFEMNIAHETFDRNIPPIIVQTLVENAIKHGIRQNAKGGYVKIECMMRDNFLIIQIINSGQVMNKNAGEIRFQKKGIGIENTRKRLAMIYGDGASFTLNNKNEKEVIAEIKIPA